MSIWSIFLVVLFFGGSIFVHELGHYLAARRRGVRVERFSIGFGPAIWSWHSGDGVEYRISWFPIGGYVLLPQLADLGPIEGGSNLDASRLPPVSYSSKMIVFAAGAAFNILFAFALACIVWVLGQPERADLATTRIGYVLPTVELADGSKVPSPASQAGLRIGDDVLAIDGHRVKDWSDLNETLITGSGRENDGRPLALFKIARGGHDLTLPVHPIIGSAEGIRQVGISSDSDWIVDSIAPKSPAARAGLEVGDTVVALDGLPVRNAYQIFDHLDDNRANIVAITVRRNGEALVVAMPPWPAGKLAADRGFSVEPAMLYIHVSPLAQIDEQLDLTVRTLFSLLNPRSDIGLSKMTGPIGIAHYFELAAESGFTSVLLFAILVNVNLAVFNLLPIPVLDGGQMLFATVGRVRGRALPINFIAATQSLFVALILMMFIYLSVSDIRRWQREIQTDRPAPEAKP